MQLEFFPDIRYVHDADELHRLAEFLADSATPALREDVALDYFRLADRLEQLAEQAREFARECVAPIP